ncbi:DUF4265 domain-containing protein [Intrasporangium sp.]|uniref:DUF4265 domain-containing protein n=1 Tax=Intrasporangium sp. TaxID=1925024 RepID=UPI003221F953
MKLPEHARSKSDKPLEVVRFSIRQDEDGWPPVSVEALWAESRGLDRLSIVSVPFFVAGVAPGDVVLTVWHEGERWASTVDLRGGHSVIRVGTFPEERGETWAVDKLNEFENMGLTCESSGPPFWLVAVDIPAGADIASIKRHLESGEKVGLWEYEEACVGGEWQDA